MSEDTSQEKTEQPTAKRLSKAREDGDVARSKELSMAMIMIVTSGLLLFVGDVIVGQLKSLVSDGLTLTREQLFNKNIMPIYFFSELGRALWSIAPLLFITFFVSLITPALMGGWVFSMKAAMPKVSKLNPIKGLGRMFGVKAAVELLKAIAKFFIVLIVALMVLAWYSDALFGLGHVPMLPAFNAAGKVLAWSVFYMCLSLVLIAAIDVPFQAYQHNKKLKMTLQEVKDELKDIEGRPEVKSAIRQKQREIAMNRMMQDVPSADVVVVNPEHYSVALKYDKYAEGAPRVIAKGVDNISEKIREVANENSIEIIRMPVLARALYYTTDIQSEIPEPLYLAVAQVLSYVYALNEKTIAEGDVKMPEISVPEEYIFDENGKSAFA